MNMEATATANAGHKSRQYKTASHALQYQLPHLWCIVAGAWKCFDVEPAKGRMEACSAGVRVGCSFHDQSQTREGIACGAHARNFATEQIDAELVGKMNAGGIFYLSMYRNIRLLYTPSFSHNPPLKGGIGHKKRCIPPGYR